MLCETPFTADAYDTPENYPRSPWEYILLGSRFSFYLRNFLVFAKAGKIAKAGKLTAERQVGYALENVRITESCGGRVHLRGLNNLNSFSEPAVIIGNHMSLLETALMHAFVRPRRDFCFVIKRSLLDVPYFGHIMRFMECIPVDRVNPREDFKTVMEVGAARLKAGKSVVIFPQSTRSAVFDPAQFNTIGIKLARHARVPVIPMALRTDFLGNGKLVKDLGPIHRHNPVWFEFGTPIPAITGVGKEEHEQIIRFIAGRVKAWGGRVKGEIS